MTTTLTFAASVTELAAIDRVFDAVAWVRGVQSVQRIAPADTDIIELKQMGTAVVADNHDAEAVASTIRSLPNIAYCEVAAQRGPL